MSCINDFQATGKMTSKIVYFTVSGRDEQAEFTAEDTAENVRDIFRSAAEANESDILKLYNCHGNLINISQKLAENSPEDRYRLEVVAAQYSGATVAAELGLDVGTLEKRLEELERRMVVERTEAPDVVYDMSRKVDALREKLENLDHLSWLGLYKDLSSRASLQPFWNKSSHSPESPEKCHHVLEKVNRLCQVQVTKEVREYLRKPSFDNWQWDDSEMIILLRQMFIDLDLITKFNIEMPVLIDWLFEVYRRYNDVPFHNFKHCFMVTQMMYGLTWLIELPKKIDDIDVLTLIVSAICHDLGHPGYNNAYQINARTELALRYNDISPLENHHCSVAFEILENKDRNILRNLDPDLFKRFREGMIRCILATDMAKHHEILKNFKSVVSAGFDISVKEHRDLVMMILIKVADISNEARPMEVADVWLECLFEEYFNQSDVEKLEGLPVAPFMDREKVTKPASQIGFIKFVLLPLFEALGELFPVITEGIITPVQKALDYYTDMQQAFEVEKKRQEEGRDPPAPGTGGQQGDNCVVNGQILKGQTLSRSVQQGGRGVQNSVERREGGSAQQNTVHQAKVA